MATNWFLADQIRLYIPIHFSFETASAFFNDACLHQISGHGATHYDLSFPHKGPAIAFTVDFDHR
jgi:hypothetical protein